MQDTTPAADAALDSNSDIIILSRPPTPMRMLSRQHTHTSGPSQRQGLPRRKRKYVEAGGGSASEVEILLTPLSSRSSDAWSANATEDPARSQDTVRRRALQTLSARGPSTMGAGQGTRRAAGDSARQGDPRYDTLDLEDELVLVFARLDLSGAPSESEDAMWWPAQVVDRGPPLRLTPFGRHPGWSAKHAPAAALALPSTSPELVRPFRAGPTQLRFDEKTFAPSRPLAELALSPRKRRRTDWHELVARWGEARDLMLKAHQDANDGMPLLLSRYIADVSSPRRNKHKRGASCVSADLSDDATPSTWKPPPPNFMYDIPGELILAKDRKRDKHCWPAKIMKYHPPRNHKEKPLYEILFFDGTVKKVPDDEDMFYTPAHEGFRTCKLGEAEDDYGLNEGARDEEEEPGFQADTEAEETDEQLRAASPPPTLPAPTAFAHDLTIAEQFAYTKPVLAALLNGRHAPSLPRHMGFMRGGRARRAVINGAWKRGELGPRDQDELDACVRRWMRRRFRRQQLGLVPPDERVIARDDAAQAAGGAEGSIGRVEQPVSVPVLDLDLDLEPSATDDSESAFSDARPPPSSLATGESIRAVSEALHEDGTSWQDDKMDVAMNAIEVDDGAGTALLSKPDDSMALGGPHDKTLSAGVPLPTYAELSPLDQITYCTSVLLPEAVLQLLLWRGGYRETPELLPPEEEARLYEIALEKADATDWVHDIIRMKRSVDRKTLPSDTPQPSDADAQRGRRGVRRR